MTEREKVIKGLECLAKRHGIVGVCEPESCPYGDLHTCENEIARDVLTLLKAQEPVESKKLMAKGKNGYKWRFYCGKCGDEIDRLDKYCRHCGRAVKRE